MWLLKHWLLAALLVLLIQLPCARKLFPHCNNLQHCLISDSAQVGDNRIPTACCKRVDKCCPGPIDDLIDGTGAKVPPRPVADYSKGCCKGTNNTCCTGEKPNEVNAGMAVFPWMILVVGGAVAWIVNKWG